MVASGIILIVVGCAFGFFAVRAWQGKVTRAYRARAYRDSGTHSPAKIAAANKAAAPLTTTGSALLVAGGVVAAVGSVGVAEVAIFSGIALFIVLLLLSAVPARRASRNVENADRG